MSNPNAALSNSVVLSELFKQYGIVSCVDEYDIVIIDIDVLHIWIAPRPYYCDRGRWLVHAESTDPIKLSLDASDGFPRYYFDNTALVTEVIRFIEARDKELKPDE